MNTVPAMHSVSRVVGGVARCYGTRVVTRAPCARAAVRAMSTVAPLTKPTEEVGAGRPALLFTPGPLTTSQAVKNAMTVDMGTRDARFMEVIKQCRNGILEVANVSQVSRSTTAHRSFAHAGLHAAAHRAPARLRHMAFTDLFALACLVEWAHWLPAASA